MRIIINIRKIIEKIEEMYYLWSIVFTLLVFILLQYNEYTKNKSGYKMLTFSNISVFIILYIVVTIIFYFSFSFDFRCLNKIQQRGGNNYEIDHSMLKKISENLDTGFSPTA